MGKFFEAIGYLTSVLLAACGIVFLVNKLFERQLDEEIEAECECGDECECDCDCGCECHSEEVGEAVDATEA